MRSQRGSSPVKADYDEVSSPDPLGNSSQELEHANTSPSRRRSRAIHSSNKRQEEQQTRMSINPELSPSKTITEQTLSPWRIRVTVEAEPEEDNNGALNENRARTVTRTMKVPLRDESSPLGPISTNRRTSGGQSAKKGRRRSGTPDPTKRTRRPSLTDLDAVVLGDDRDEDEWGFRKSTPKKRSNSRTKTSQAKSLGSRRGSSAAEFEIREDETAAPPQEAENTNDLNPSESLELRQIDLNRVSMRPRSASTRERADKDVEDAGHDNQAMPSGKLLASNRKVSTNSAMSYPTPSPSASEHGNSDEVGEANANERNLNHEIEEGLDTMIESEGFTMIDLDSIPSIKQLRSSPEQSQSHQSESSKSGDRSGAMDEGSREHDSEANSVAYPSLSQEDETGLSTDLPSSPPDMSSQFGAQLKPYSIGHLQIPSSTHVYRQRQVTPVNYSSPRLPSPPRPLPAKNRQTPNSTKAMKAGMVLQGALTPEELEQRNEERSRNVHVSDETKFFEGFDSSTMREMRAGLRFGEELAKRHRDSPVAMVKDLQSPTASFDSGIQVWRSENAGSRKPISSAPDTKSKSAPRATKTMLAERTEPATNARVQLEQEWQHERDIVIEEANKIGAVVIESDEEMVEENFEEDAGNETDGDIWLAEARNTSSPRDEITKVGGPQFTDSERQQREKAREALTKPKRNLIPSPWKRGENVNTENGNATSMLSGDTSMSGLFWKEPSSDSDFKFGAGIVAKPDKVRQAAQTFDRRRSGFFDCDRGLQQTRRLSPRHELEGHDSGETVTMTLENDVHWRDAENVIEEETSLLEAEKLGQSSTAEIQNHTDQPTSLHETSLELPEQDLSSSPPQSIEPRTIPVNFNDESIASQSEGSTIHQYQQRRSLSPSKDRPSTPRSAMKGGRFSNGLETSDEETSDRRVVWAKRSSCMNEIWEESSRSVRSGPETMQEESQVTKEETREPEPEQVEVQPRKGWFSWFRKEDNNTPDLAKPSTTISPLDGTNDEKESNEEGEDDFAPTSRHTSAATSTTRYSTTSSPASSSITATPSYLLPPSYPSDPRRNIEIPLTTSGEFTNTHFKTLHIIYRKSQKPRFHAPQYPDEVRPVIRDLVKRKWSMEVDEGSSALGEVFTFKIRETEARVLERFMQEVEHGYHGNQEVRWGWTVEQLASWMGRIAVGEVVRAEEAAVGSKGKK